MFQSRVSYKITNERFGLNPEVVRLPNTFSHFEFKYEARYCLDMDNQRTLGGTNQSAEFTRMDSSTVPLLDLKTDDALETTFPSITCNQKRRLLKDLNDRCIETMEFLGTQYDILRALDALVDEIEQEPHQ